MQTSLRVAAALVALGTLAGCSDSSGMERRVAAYKSVRLEADLGSLTDKQRQMVGLFIDAAHWMDEAFWTQAFPYGARTTFLASIDDAATQRFAEINYGPWDRLGDDAPFIDEVGPKPLGANFYPVDMTQEEFEAACAEAPDGGAALRSPYTRVRRDPEGQLVTLPYHQAYQKQMQLAANKLREAAQLAEDPGLRRYLELRADALFDDDYRPSDMAWMDMKDNVLDIVIGPIENYEDKLYNYKTAFEAYVLIKDLAWSSRLDKYATMLPGLQRGLPVPDEYKREQPGRDADLNVYDVVYYAGDCNAGAKTIAINLPNDEQVQLEKGSRRLQLKNAMRAKYDHILRPIADVLIAEDQRSEISFEAFFGNTMFHEVAHGLGIKSTLDGSGTVRAALRDYASAMEEGKADVLGLYMVTQLDERGELEVSLDSHYVTFLASIFRSIRFGASSAHGKANMIRFNFFREAGAFARDESSGTYRVELQRMREATDALSEKILRLQGDGDYEGVRAFVDERAVIGEQLQADLDRVSAAGIPVDIVFEQGKRVLGLQ